MPEWTVEDRRLAFGEGDDITSYETNYCAGRYTLFELDRDDGGIRERRAISKWLSISAPNAVHRSPGWNETANRPWLVIGTVDSRGSIARDSRVVVFPGGLIGFRKTPDSQDKCRDLLCLVGQESIEAAEFIKVLDRASRQIQVHNNDPVNHSYLCWSLRAATPELRLAISELLKYINKHYYANNYEGFENYILGKVPEDLRHLALFPSIAERLKNPEPQTRTQTQLPTHPYMDMKNIILFGPPGTGKTFATLGLALHYCGIDRKEVNTYASACVAGQYSEPPNTETWVKWLDEFERLRSLGRIEFTTFHQNYAYEDFVEGIRPQTNEGAVSYATESGIFKKIAYRALYAWLKGDGKPCPIGREEEKGVQESVLQWLEKGTRDQAWEQEPLDTKAPAYVLVIDEINRGNMARILGELITLLEDSKRARHQLGLGHQPLKAALPYTREPFIVPPNLYIIGTMNTADRSLIGLDVALRRRFHFVELPPRPEALSTNVAGINLQDFLAKLNERIEGRLDADHLIGHAFFASVETVEQIKSVMTQKVIPLLREYFHDRPEDLKAVLDVPGELQFLRFAGQGRNLRFAGVDPTALSSPEVYRLFSGGRSQ
jgi:hypothetical protein